MIRPSAKTAATLGRRSRRVTASISSPLTTPLVTACAARLGYMADMLTAAYAASGSANREQWRIDNWGAVCARIGAAHAVTSGVVNGLLMDAVTLRERLPNVAAVFAEGLITYRLVH
ncbi:hypothetical protein C6A85_74325, partial [Mycobacterium sp. ITM-2017-0098]